MGYAILGIGDLIIGAIEIWVAFSHYPQNIYAENLAIGVFLVALGIAFLGVGKSD